MRRWLVLITLLMMSLLIVSTTVAQNAGEQVHVVQGGENLFPSRCAMVFRCRPSPSVTALPTLI